MSVPVRFIVASITLHICCLSLIGMQLPSAQKQINTAEWVVDLTTDLRSDIGQEAPDDAVPTPPTEAQKSELESSRQVIEQESVFEQPGNSTTAVIEQAVNNSKPAVQAESLLQEKNAQMASAFRNTMDNQAILMQLRQYFRMASSSVRGMVDGTLPQPDKLALDGKRGYVIIAYNNGSEIESLTVSSENEQLREFLQSRINWQLAPTPKSCLLPFKTVTYSISFARNKVNIAISPG